MERKGWGQEGPRTCQRRMQGKAEENDELEGRAIVKMDETPRYNDGDPPPGFRPTMEIFQDENTHV